MIRRIAAALWSRVTGGAAVPLIASVFAGLALFYFDRTLREAGRVEERARIAAVGTRAAQAEFHKTLEQERIANETDARAQDRLDRLRAHYAGRLRQQPAAPRAGDVQPAPGAPVPADPPAPEQAACRPGAEWDALEQRAAEDALMLLEWQQFYRDLQKARGER